MSKKTIVFIIAAAWFLIALVIIISKEHLLSTGQAILLETVPVDPRDMLRGDYVILNYKISTINLSQVTSELNSYSAGQYVMIKLEPEGKLWQPKAVWVKNAPAGGVSIRGKVKSSLGAQLRLEYGLESYFVPEGKGSKIEEYLRRNSAGMVTVEIIVDNKGRAMIKQILINEAPVQFN